MDINQLESFLDYKIDINIKPQDLVDVLISKAETYLPNSCKEEIQKAYEFAAEAHKWQIRLSWEEYIIHPIQSTLILMELKPDINSIQTCLLHDVIEDTDITEKDVKEVFWEEVAKLCVWLVKVAKIKYTWEDRHLETLKKTFLAMAEDLRVIFIKLADRIHNMQTLHYHPKENKRENIAKETMKIYVQIAKRLWLYQYQVALENACFKTLYPVEFENISKHLKKNFAWSNRYIKKWSETINKLIKKEWLENFSVKWRMKSPYRIWEKMEHRYQTKDITHIMDLLAFRIITDNISDCYSTLWIIHKYYTPLIKKIKDYIAVPKFNWYKSIHTTILGMFKFPVEIQIRTHEMDDVAEYWVAAHYSYSDTDGPNQVNKKQAEWMKKLQQLVNAYTESDSKEHFKDKLKIEILNKETFIYTPKGDIIEVSKWSTVLDFAFHIHTDIWLRFKNAIVNGEITPMTYVPNTWDIVKINTFRYKYTANKHRTSILKTPSAKAKVLKYVKTEHHDELVERSMTIFNTKLIKFWLPQLNSKENKITKFYEKKELQNKLIDALENKWIYNEILKTIYPDEYKKHIDKQHPQNIQKPEKTNKLSKKTHTVIIDEDKLLNYYLCPECRPSLSDKIIAKTWRNGIKVHTLSCKAMKTISPWKLLEAHWQWNKTNKYIITSTVSAHKKFNFINLLEVFDNLNIAVQNFSIKNDEKSEKRVIKITREINNPSQIWMISQYTKKFGKTIKTIGRSIK